MATAKKADIVSFEHSMEWKKKDIGTIGELDFQFSGVIVLDGKPLDENATRFILHWGFRQPLLNAYADESNPDQDKSASELWLAKYNDILAGNVSAGTRERISPVWAEMRLIIAPKVAKNLGHADVNAAAKAVGKGWTAMVDANVRKYESKVRPVAEANIAARNIELDDETLDEIDAA